MSIMPMKKKCPNCHKKYDFNPDIGKIVCPRCGGLDIAKSDRIGGIFGQIHDNILPDEVEVKTENPFLDNNGMPKKMNK